MAYNKHDIEGLVIPEENIDHELHEKVLASLLEEKLETRYEMLKFITKQTQLYKKRISCPNLLYTYRRLIKKNVYKQEEKYLKMLQSKLSRSDSGVQVVAILTSPFPETMIDGKLTKQAFSCKYDCTMCPNQPKTPRSYINLDMENKDIKMHTIGEPAVLRAQYNNFDPVLQIHDRLNSYVRNGMEADKLEIIVLGGTWSSYPHDYQENFIRDIYYAANIYNNHDKRNRCDLEQEKKINESTECHIIGLTLETRPDQINKTELYRFRKYGVTRVQLGIQHTNDRILRRINRMCYAKHSIRAIKMLKDNCFKVDIHLMPDLPKPLIGKDKYATTDNIDTEVDMLVEDKIMFDTVINNSDWQADQWKIYPCMVVPWTKLFEEYKEGLYKPYGEEKDLLNNLLIDVKVKVKPWVRINRVVRDIPMQYIKGGMHDVSGRQTIEKEMKKRNLKCRCIRCREVKKQVITEEAVIKVRKYEASGGIEYFVSFETEDESVIFGFLRLRINGMNNSFFAELNDSALIRELHVYGTVVKVNDKSDKTQHKGYGRKLLQKAYEISRECGYNKIAVISGNGVKNYYRKDGFVDGEYFMLKKLNNTQVKIFVKEDHKLLHAIIFVVVILIIRKILFI